MNNNVIIHAFNVANSFLALCLLYIAYQIAVWVFGLHSLPDGADLYYHDTYFLVIHHLIDPIFFLLAAAILSGVTGYLLLKHSKSS